MRIVMFFALMLCFQMGYSQEWLTDFDKATEIAAREHHNIILVFQGSDWCAPCIKLEKEIWSSPEFKDYASDHFVLLKADFPRRKKNQLPKEQQKKNEQLAEQYNQEGFFPLVVVLDPQGKVLGKTGYENVPPRKYIEILESIEAL